jgi:hypothetical protein
MFERRSHLQERCAGGTSRLYLWSTGSGTLSTDTIIKDAHNRTALDWAAVRHHSEVVDIFRSEMEHQAPKADPSDPLGHSKFDLTESKTKTSNLQWIGVN